MALNNTDKPTVEFLVNFSQFMFQIVMELNNFIVI